MDNILDGEKVVLILEHSDHKLNVKEKNGYILEGVFCQFGVKNNNQRIYEEAEYLPHLDYLNDKIKLGNLTGQLDHPQDFEVRLSQASHVIESLQYDSNTRQINGRIRLLSTQAGRDARALVDDGVQLSISSRAAGVVESDRSVKIKRIFTYDLVADPGFANAQLNRLNESLGLESDSNIQIYDLSSKFSNIDAAISALDVQKQTKNQPSKMDQKFVTEEVLNDYSIEIRKEFEKLYKKLDESKVDGSETDLVNKLISEIESLTKYNAYLTETVDQVIEYTNYIAENTNKVRKYTEYLAENLSGSIDYTEHVAEQVSNTQHYANYLAENLDRGIQYTEHVGMEVENQGKLLSESIKYANYLAESLDKGIQYSDYIADNVDKTQKRTEYLAENVDKTVRYANYLAEKLDTGLMFSDYIADNVDKTQKYSNYLAEKLDQSIQHNDYLTEHLDNAIRYSEYVAEHVKPYTNDEENTETVNESVSNTNDYKNVNVSENIVDRVDAILESLRQQKIENVARKNNYQFMSMLSEAKQNEFLALDEPKKEKVVKALNESTWFGEGDIVKIWNKSLTSDNSNLPKWVTDMPVEYTPIWESMSSEDRNKIVAQSKLYNLNTPYQIKNFWSTRGLDPNKPRVSVLNENASISEDLKNVNDLGYTSNYVDDVAKSLSARFNR